MKNSSKMANVWFEAVLFVFFGLLYLSAVPYPAKAKQFPQLLAIIGLIFCGISLFMNLTRKQAPAGIIMGVDDTELTAINEETRKTRKKRYYKAWGIILVSIAAGFLGGFLFTTFFLFAGFALFFGEMTRNIILRNFMVAIFMTILIHFIFERIMHVPLLRGILW